MLFLYVIFIYKNIKIEFISYYLLFSIFEMIYQTCLLLLNNIILMTFILNKHSTNTIKYETSYNKGKPNNSDTGELLENIFGRKNDLTYFNNFEVDDIDNDDDYGEIPLDNPSFENYINIYFNNK
jgi:hypothetical protein